MQPLTAQQVCNVSSLVGIGCKSGDTVTGLSGVRRTRGLAVVFVAVSLSDNTRSELNRLQHRGTQVYSVDDMDEFTAVMGRLVRVVGIKKGSLADGIAGKLSGAEAEQTAARRE